MYYSFTYLFLHLKIKIYKFMDTIRIKGGSPLNGEIFISGAKNSALPVLASCLLSDKPLHLKNLPNLADIESMINLLEDLGVEILMDKSKNTATLNAKNISKTEASYDIVRKMRASIVVLGPILARMGKVRVSMPGGCSIGARPVDIHIKGLIAMGADIKIENGYIDAVAVNGLHSCEYTLPFPSVTATENLMMAACFASGRTVLKNIAREPEIYDLAKCLNSMGASVELNDGNNIVINGVKSPSFNESTHEILPDRIETGTYAVAALITNGEIRLRNTDIALIPAFSDKIKEAGASIEINDDGFTVKRASSDIKGVDIMTEPYPGFPTDLQAQKMALMCFCDGSSMITETIFENRFMHVPELCRMGADITIHGSSSLVRGKKSLAGAPVMATDLRASVSLVLAALAANGDTLINRIYHLDRGYERLEEKLQNCGAIIERLK